MWFIFLLELDSLKHCLEESQIDGRELKESVSAICNLFRQQAKQSSNELPILMAMPLKATFDKNNIDWQQPGPKQETLDPSRVNDSKHLAAGAQQLSEAIAHAISKILAPLLAAKGGS